MKNEYRPKAIAGILTVGIVVIVGGTVAAVAGQHSDGPSTAGLAAKAVSESPSATPSSIAPSAGTSPSVTPSPVATAVPTQTTVSQPAPSASPAVKPPVTYVVKHGDTLSGIANWFKLHGYQDLYVANWKVIGSNPDLIIPGEQITISGGLMTLASPK